MTSSDARQSSVEPFEAERGRLFGIAYRLLGTIGDAEDAVQDAYLRWQQADRSAVVSAQAFLTTIVTRLCLDRLRALQAQRESYVGPWLPEPIVDIDLSLPLQRDETLSIALLRMLERLAPNERVVFVLREAFDLEHAEIATILDAAVPTCRQWYRRARAHLAGAKRFDLAPAAQVAMLQRLAVALSSGDPHQVAELLAEDAQFNTDGGGKVQAAIVCVRGTARIAQVLLHLWRKQGEATVRTIVINGGYGLALLHAATLDSVIALEVVDGKLLCLDAIRNPDKLTRAVSALQSN